jgi:hypothetical protein
MSLIGLPFPFTGKTRGLPRLQMPIVLLTIMHSHPFVAIIWLSSDSFVPHIQFVLAGPTPYSLMCSTRLPVENYVGGWVWFVTSTAGRTTIV